MKNIKHIIITIFLILSFFVNSLSQTRKTVFAEVLGNAPHVSFNYDQRLKPKTDFGLGFRAGLSGSFGWHDYKAVTVGLPVGVNYLYGKNLHALEIGIVGVPEFVLKKPQTIANSAVSETKDIAPFLFHTNLNVGYRFQPIKDKGLMINVLWTPAIIVSEDAYFGKSRWKMFGVGVGYSFK